MEGLSGCLLQYRRALCLHYVMSQWLATYFTFCGTFLSVDYEENERPQNMGGYLFVLGVPVIAANLRALTAYYFQGQKILDADATIAITMAPASIEVAETPGILSRAIRFYGLEILYLSFSTLLLLIENYFIIASFAAMLEKLHDPDADVPSLRSIGKLSPFALSFLFIKTFLVDIPFHFSNAQYDAAVSIKNKFAACMPRALIQYCWRPALCSAFSLSLVLAWLNSMGALSHTLSDVVDLFLSLPISSRAYRSLYESDFFIPVILLLSPLLTFFITINLIQTIYFEGHESNTNLISLFNANVPEAARYHEYKTCVDTVLRRMLSVSVSRMEVLCFLVGIEAPLHAVSDIMPITLTIQAFASRYPEINKNQGVLTLIITLLCVYAGAGSLLGTYVSEVKGAQKQLRQFFTPVLGPAALSSHTMEVPALSEGQTDEEQTTLVSQQIVHDGPFSMRTPETQALVPQGTEQGESSRYSYPRL